MRKASSKKEGETKFSLAKHFRQHSVFVERVYAQGGMVVTTYLDAKDGKVKNRMLSPKETMDRVEALAGMPKDKRREELLEAAVRAAKAAARQRLDGNAAVESRPLTRREIAELPRPGGIVDKHGRPVAKA